jgi:DNA phosphorothioation-associated putative methyltransferase
MAIMSGIGKRVVDDLYVHLSAVDHIKQDEWREAICSSLGQISQSSALANSHPNVAKLNLRTGRISLLEYGNFDEDPFPELLASWTFASAAAADPTYRTYTHSLNPPILHRKELLVPPSHPGRAQWCELTAEAEALGLFDDTRAIGFRLNWQRLIQQRGYQLVGKALLPIGNETNGCELAEPILENNVAEVQRHLTALHRASLSAPVQLLIRHGLLGQEDSLFDYGCGRGGDIEALKADGYSVAGWDPHYAQTGPILESDVVNLGFVVNVIEDPAERVDALQRAFALARRVLVVAVMLYSVDKPGRPFRDGFMTSRNTFQKYFSQGEFKDYLEQVLHQPAFMVGPGIALVFADKDAEQSYSAGRYRRQGLAHRLLAARLPRVRPPRIARELRAARPPRLSKAEAQLAEHRPLLDRLWTLILELGRQPEPDELTYFPEVEQAFASLGRAMRLIALHYDRSLWQAAAAARADDVQLYMAALQFAKRKTYRKLDMRLQRDIKAFFGDYQSAQAAGLRLLLDAADPDQLLTACRTAAAQGLGWLDDQHSLQLHVGMVDRLPAVLRAYIACGLILWESLSEVQLVKIHIGSGKLTLMEFEDFDSSPVPTLCRRIKVNVRRQDYDLFDYGSPEFPKPLLYRKSRYLNEDSPGYAEQLAFDDTLESLGIVESSGYGPSAALLHERLDLHRLRLDGMQLAPCDHIPDLDQACGANFTYRAFIECGETQQQLGLRNLPLDPATYNSLNALATQILDPVIEYFGSIKLTYGFCSPELSKHISKRVAPKLDQHACSERNRAGKLICDRGGAACDFIVEDEDMREVADWLIENTRFDRLYYYGRKKPVHVSQGVQNNQTVIEVTESSQGKLVPKPYANR